MSRDPMPEFDKVLVANRGEIARRIFRTLREMGLASVAVFSDADRDAPHAAEADEAVCLGPAPSRESYLDPEKVIAAARATGAGAIHPGYGFLAENADFAERCAEEGIVFVGPSAEAIRRMGDKAAAKELAARVGVPVLAGFEVAGLDAGTIARRAGELGYPLLVKATAGGGGKGMRTVHEASTLEEALGAARREAEAAFGDGTLLLERLLERPRHVEIQILGDAHGQVLSLGERDCSVQRRHQKVFEEAPSPAVGVELRRRMGEAAVALAREVGYQGAGTVEFLLDADGAFYFLEMNTRLQVEHPVTEMITGLDLVRWQIEIARGEPLDLVPEALEIKGHAIEARLYAEDPANDFLPVTGRIALWSVPSLPGLRVDSGVEEGTVVGVHYDPLLAKVIAHGTTREEARRRLHRGLSELAVGGMVTNRDFLLGVLEHEAFRRGEIDTGFLERHPKTREPANDAAIHDFHVAAATLHLFAERRRRPGPIPPGVPSGWRQHRWRPQEQAFELAGERLTVRYVALADERFTIEVVTGGSEPRTLEAQLVAAGEGEIVAELDGVRRRFRVGRKVDRGLSVHGLTIHGLGRVLELEIVPRFPVRRAAAVAGGCAAPMTGKIIEILVEEGERVEAGATLVVLEAMKMEHRLKAQEDGVVEAVRVVVGQMVDPDEVLVVVGC